MLKSTNGVIVVLGDVVIISRKISSFAQTAWTNSFSRPSVARDYSRAAIKCLLTGLGNWLVLSVYSGFGPLILIHHQLIIFIFF